MNDVELELFQDKVFEDGLLESWAKGQLSQTELVNRLEFLKSQAMAVSEEGPQDDKPSSWAYTGHGRDYS